MEHPFEWWRRILIDAKDKDANEWMDGWMDGSRDRTRPRDNHQIQQVISNLRIKENQH